MTNTAAAVPEQPSNLPPTIPQGPSDRLIDVRELGRIIGIGITSIYGLVKTGDLPAPVKIGAASRWALSDAHNFLQARLATRSIPSQCAAPPPADGARIHNIVQDVLSHTRGQPNARTVVERVLADPRVATLSADQVRGIAVQAAVDAELAERTKARVTPQRRARRRSRAGRNS